MGVVLSIGKNAYDQGFNIPTPTLTEKNLPDQTGKVFLITGANSGVGYNVASILYSRNATVYLGCRTQSKAEEAISTIKSAHAQSHGHLHYLHLDLADLTTIKASAEAFLSRESKLHWLDNNAGVMFPPKGAKGPQGIDLQYTTNVLGPFLLTKLLLPVLRRTAETEPKGSVRVSWASSFAIQFLSPAGGIQFKPDPSSTAASTHLVPEDFNGTERTYGSAKTANYFLAYEFGRRGLDSHGDGVLHNAYNPGNLKSNLQQHVNKWPYLLGPVMSLVMNNVILHEGVYGAYTEIFAGLSSDLSIDRDQGGYVVPWGRRSTWVRGDVLEQMGEGKGSEKLWDWCERVTGPYA